MWHHHRTRLLAPKAANKICMKTPTLRSCMNCSREDSRPLTELPLRVEPRAVGKVGGLTIWRSITRSSYLTAETTLKSLAA